MMKSDKNKMFRNLFASMLMLSLLLMSFGAAQAAPEKAVVSTDNLFGYTVENALTGQWEEIGSSGTAVSFAAGLPNPGQGTTTLDDSYSELIPIGFNFPFFENTFSGLYVSTNGFISFSELNSGYADNQQIPFDLQPNNIIAPFWDDLIVQSTNSSALEWDVYYKLFDEESPKRLVIQWEQVVRLGEEGVTNTFQVILEDTGDIYFVYGDLNGTLTSATVGIEDGDGVDGVDYLYNGSGTAVEPNKAIKFTYPAGDVHLKVKPLYQSGFLQEKQIVFDFTLQNTGSVASTFNLEDSFLDGQDWPITFLDENGSSLTDTGSDGKVDTGLVASGASKLIKVKVAAPADAVLGQYTQMGITATSVEDPTKTYEVSLQASEPAQFMQGFNDSNLDGTAMLVTSDKLDNHTVASLPYGKPVFIGLIGTQRYLYAWEESSGPTQNIKYLIFNSAFSVSSVRNLVDNPDLIQDSTPSFAANSDSGNIAVAYTQKSLSTLITNIFFGWMQENGQFSTAPINLTNSGASTTKYSVPILAVNDNQRAFITWESESGGGAYNDVHFAVYDINGVQKKFTQVTNSSTANKKYFSPQVIALSSNQFLLSYTVFDKSTETYQIEYQFFNENGDAGSSGVLTNSNGTGQDMTQLTNGNILIAWTNAETERTTYAILNASGTEIKTAGSGLASPDKRNANAVSVSYDEFGHGILTWTDEWDTYAYYALVNSSGDLITPAMYFNAASDTDYPSLLSSFNGQGLAPLLGDLLQNVYLPLVVR